MSQWQDQHRAVVPELLAARADPRDPRVPQWARIGLALAVRSPRRQRELRDAYYPVATYRIQAGTDRGMGRDQEKIPYYFSVI